jgi:hypothetical protein
VHPRFFDRARIWIAAAALAGVPQPAGSECGNMGWWFPDESDPEIHEAIVRERVSPPHCVGSREPDTACHALLALGDRLVAYLLRQYEHARESPSRRHQGESMLWLFLARCQAASAGSSVADDYVARDRAAILTPPPQVAPERWQAFARDVLGPLPTREDGRSRRCG